VSPVVNFQFFNIPLPYLNRPPPWGPLGIIFYYSEDLPVQKIIIILRGGSVVGIISHEDLKKLVENSMRQWHPQSEIHKKMILRLDIGKH
jgi:hypothetical protein